MVIGWRKAFCKSIPKDKDTPTQKQPYHGTAAAAATSTSTTNISPKPSCSRFGFFSNQSQPVSTTATPSPSIPNSPKLQCKTSKTPKKSGPSTPKSPSSFSQLFRSSLRLSKIRCGICTESVKSGQGTAIFSAEECSHSFHLHCITAHFKKRQTMICPVCGTNWKEITYSDLRYGLTVRPPDSRKAREVKSKNLRIYNDDEPLMSPTSGARFHPIPESYEDGGDQDGIQEFQGFFVTAPSPLRLIEAKDQIAKDVDVSLLPETVVVSSGKGYETYAAVLKIKAPPPSTAAKSGACRAPIDLVTVLDVSANMAGNKVQMMKKAMRLVISSLSSADRLSIVAFNATSKRLLPLRRMTTDGRRSARKIVDALGNTGEEACTNDALKKAAKVIDDRRERNAVATVILLSDGKDERLAATSANQNRRSTVVSTTRLAHNEITVHTVRLGDGGEYGNAPSENTIARCISNLLNVVFHDLRLQLGFVSGSETRAHISAIYSLTGYSVEYGSGSVRIGDLYAEEERQILVEFKLPASSVGSHQLLSVRSGYIDPLKQKRVFSKQRDLSVPRPQAFRSSSSSGIRRLRNLYVSTRAITESRQLMERNDFSGAHHLLKSAIALLMQSSSSSAEEFLSGVDMELAELNRRRQLQLRRNIGREVGQQLVVVEEKSEPLTPTSAWRAAEKLAKLAIIRKSMNRVSDLYGFENAGF